MIETVEPVKCQEEGSEGVTDPEDKPKHMTI